MCQRVQLFPGVNMITLYYGNGECSIEGAKNIKGVQIFYKGAVEIEDNTPDGYEIIANDKQIIIFSISSSLSLNNLFAYTGTFQIVSVIIADENAEKVSVSIQKVMDYSELINTNAEDMTFKNNLYTWVYSLKNFCKYKKYK